jgi:hypothetical protein
MKVSGMLRMWLRDNAQRLRAREAEARNAYRSSGTVMHQSSQTLADCHAAAALIYETELSKHAGADAAK